MTNLRDTIEPIGPDIFHKVTYRMEDIYQLVAAGKTLLALTGQMREALVQAHDKLKLECSGYREYKGGSPTQTLFPQIEKALAAYDKAMGAPRLKPSKQPPA